MGRYPRYFNARRGTVIQDLSEYERIQEIASRWNFTYSRWMAVMARDFLEKVEADPTFLDTVVPRFFELNRQMDQEVQNHPDAVPGVVDPKPDSPYL
jgi:hypothetical protein